MRPTSTLTPLQGQQLMALYQGQRRHMHRTTAERLENLGLMHYGVTRMELTERGKRVARVLLGAKGTYV